jgi:mono/diheme cytochrome c family protein
MFLKHALIILAVLGLFISTAWADDSLSATVSMPTKYRSFFESNCIECHNAETREGQLQLDDVSFVLDSVENAERWQKILNQINSGDMPPEDAVQPDEVAKAEFLDVLANTLVRARGALSDTGGEIVMRRLNRREYKNTIRDLLGFELDVSDLPVDRGVGGFDTAGVSLFMSSDQFDQYIALGRRALDEAFARSAITPTEEAQRRHSEHREVEELTKRVVRGTYNQYYLGGFKMGNAWRASDRSKPPSEFGLADETEVDYRLDAFKKYGPSFAAYLANPLSDTGALLTSYSVTEAVIALPPDTPSDWDKSKRDPVASGNYLLKMRIGVIAPAESERIFVEMGTRAPNVEFSYLRSFEITGTVAQPQILEVLVSITADGPRSFVFREKRPQLPGDKVFLEAIARTGVIPDPKLWVDWVEWDGPLPTPTDKDQVHQLLIENRGGSAESDQARTIIEQFATRAFRDRKPDTDFVDRLVAIFEAHRRAGRSFEDSLKESLCVVLASPGFLYLSEPSAETESRQLRPHELAARLSYFLWSAPPDEQLLALARSGELQKPTALSEQVDRMLADERAREFVIGFTHQWLGMDRLDFFQFNPELYPDFDESTKAAAKQEVFQTVEHLLRNQGSLHALLKSDFVVVNGLLADFYDIEGVAGDEFRRVSLPPNSPRGGLLGMAAILAMGSNGEVTSPVERGAWVLRKLLNNPPPPAPPNIPQISRLQGELLTTRQRLRAHQEEPQCAACHRKIDPIGLGLENFNAVGKWRTEDSYEKSGVGKKSWPIEPAGAFYNGPPFQDFFEMRDLIAARSDDFSRGFTAALIEYALGRQYGFSDDDLRTRIMEYASNSDFALPDFIHALVASKEFQRK